MGVAEPNEGGDVRIDGPFDRRRARVYRIATGESPGRPQAQALVKSLVS